MVSGEFTQGSGSYAETLLNQSKDALQRAVRVVSPENPDANPLEVFPAPNTLRAEDPGLVLTPEQETELRFAAAELGFGRATDRRLSEQNIRGAHVIIEGGQPHKMLAEAQLVVEDPDAMPSSIIFSASQKRSITNEAEKQSAEKLLGRVGDTEYQVAKDVIASLPGFVATNPVIQIGFAYDISNGFKVNGEVINKEQYGQFLQVGFVGNVPIILMRIDREDYTDNGEPKYRNQPGSADIIKIIDAITNVQFMGSLPLAFVTSSTYEASRSVDVVRAGLETGRTVAIASYGTERLARVKGESAPAPAPINQLPGELHKLAQQVVKLEQTLRG